MISLCITSYNEDCNLINNLLSEFKKQTDHPEEIIIYISNIRCLDIYVPDYIIINNNNIPIYTVISNKKTNQAIARNILSKIASYNYVMFFDVDDIPHRQKIAITKKILASHSNIDFFCHGYHSNSPDSIKARIDETKIKLYPVIGINPHNTNVECEAVLHHAHITVKKNVFNKVSFNESNEYYRSEDGKFCQDLYSNGFKGFACKEQLVNYTT